MRNPTVHITIIATRPHGDIQPIVVLGFRLKAAGYDVHLGAYVVGGGLTHYSRILLPAVTSHSPVSHSDGGPSLQ